MTQYGQNDFLVSNGIPLAIANDIDEICDNFEDAWNNGKRPSISCYLAKVVEPHVSHLLSELVRLDIEYRFHLGESPEIDEYITQYPDYTEALEKLGFTKSSLSKQQSHPSPVHVLGRYHLVEQLGEGGFGIVWKAWDTHLNRWVALKVARLEIRPLLREIALIREARVVSGIRHPSIVQVYDAGRIDNTPYIASQYIDGVSLREWSKSRAMSSRDVARIVSVVASALESVRDTGLVHRDLKPSNVLVDQHGNPHIADFGLAIQDTQESGSHSVVPNGGTPAYMSPEQVRGDKLDHRSDVYSLGVTLFELLTGELPFQGVAGVLRAKIEAGISVTPRQIDSKISRDLETICLKAMHKDIAHRYQTAGELAEDLRKFLNGKPIVACPTGSVKRIWLWGNRNRILALACSVICLTSSVAIALGVYLTFFSHLPAEGERTIALTTIPEGARIVFYQLDPRTGEPNPKLRTEAPTLSPTKMSLPPGDYFVVAALDSNIHGKRRFHEVYRHVPSVEETVSPSTGNRSWQILRKFAEQSVQLAQIVIPESDVDSGMVYLEGSDSFRMGKPGIPLEAVHYRGMRSFLIDRTEVTVGQCKEIRNGPITIDSRYMPKGDSYAATVNYDLAMDIAERLGKRLPREVEYEFAATNRGTTPFPWGESRKQLSEYLAAMPPVGPVGSPSFDATLTAQPIFGLGTNVAEWTSTYASHYPALKNMPIQITGKPEEMRVVRGGFFQSSPSSRHEKLTLSRRFVRVFQTDSRIGFRCVRSATPHLLSSDFAESRKP